MCHIAWVGSFFVFFDRGGGSAANAVEVSGLFPDCEAQLLHDELSRKDAALRDDAHPLEYWRIRARWMTAGAEVS